MSSNCEPFDKTKSVLSISAFILGLLSYIATIFLGIVGFIAAILAIVVAAITIRRKEGIKGLAVAGLVLGIIYCAIWLTVVPIMCIFAFAPASFFIR